ncbi:hypothetical protein HHE014_08800 [Helicobacter heilmannii]|nr:hypothetical protein HHE014_08800 [Helicobacter heilmannii]
MLVFLKKRVWQICLAVCMCIALVACSSDSRKKIACAIVKCDSKEDTPTQPKQISKSQQSQGNKNMSPYNIAQTDILYTTIALKQAIALATNGYDNDKDAQKHAKEIGYTAEDFNPVLGMGFATDKDRNYFYLQHLHDEPDKNNPSAPATRVLDIYVLPPDKNKLNPELLKEDSKGHKEWDFPYYAHQQLKGYMQKDSKGEKFIPTEVVQRQTIKTSTGTYFVEGRFERDGAQGVKGHVTIKDEKGNTLTPQNQADLEKFVSIVKLCGGATRLYAEHHNKGKITLSGEDGFWGKWTSARDLPFDDLINTKHAMSAQHQGGLMTDKVFATKQEQQQPVKPPFIVPKSTTQESTRHTIR